MKMEKLTYKDMAEAFFSDATLDVERLNNALPPKFHAHVPEWNKNDLWITSDEDGTVTMRCDISLLYAVLTGRVFPPAARVWRLALVSFLDVEKIIKFLRLTQKEQTHDLS